jgi:CRP-like cAMP-binding protein/cytidylate kinase
MTQIGQCLSCGMGSLESGADLSGPFARCHLCGWHEDFRGMAPYRTPTGLPTTAGAMPQGVGDLVPPPRQGDGPQTSAPAATATSTATRLVVAVSGQHGTGAREIGRRVARALGCDHYDRLVLEGVARRLGATVEAVEARERRPVTRWERARRFLERALTHGSLGGWAADPYSLPPSSALLAFSAESETGPKTSPLEIDERSYLAALKAELGQLAARGEAVIVHAGACAILPADPEVFRVGVFAPLFARVNNVLAGEGAMEVEAVHLELMGRDRARDSLLAPGVSRHPDDPSNFDLSVNTGALTVEDAAEQVLSAIRTLIDRRRGGVAARRQGDAERQALPTQWRDRSGDEITRLLGGVDIFSALPDSQVREIARLGSVVTVPAGTVLASEESVGEAVYAVLAGQVELSSDSEVGRITVRVAHDGEAFPLAAIIGTGKIITRAQAMSDLRLWRVDRVALRGYLKAHPEAGLPVYDAAARIMADRYRQTLSRLTHAAESALVRARPRVTV